MPDIANLVHETSSTTGTGAFTLSAESGKQRFSDAFGTGSTPAFWYFISNRSASEWEVGMGHMSDANTLVRDTVLNSTNSGATVNFSAGTKDVANDIPAAGQFTQVNVKAFGAVGDYSRIDDTGTDDTAAIQAALDYAEDKGIGVVYFPAPANGKTYGISEQIVVPEVTIIRGDGVAYGNHTLAEPSIGTAISAMSTYDDTSGAMVQLGRNPGKYETGMGVEDIELHCNGVAPAGIFTATSQEPGRISRVRVRGFTENGVIIDGSLSSTGSFRASHTLLMGVECFPQHDANVNAGFLFNDTMNAIIMIQCTANGNFGTGTRDFGVHITDARVLALGCNIEGFAEGWRNTSNGWLDMQMCTGHSSTTTLVHNEGRLVAHNLNGRGSPTIIQDDTNDETITTETFTSYSSLIGFTRGVRSRGDNTTLPGLFINDANSASATVADFQGRRASPAANDLGIVNFKLNNSDGTPVDFARLAWLAISVSAGSEAGQLQFLVRQAGALVAQLVLQNNQFRPPVAKSGLIALGRSDSKFASLSLAAYTVANLPTASSVGSGGRANVTDSTVTAAGNFGAVVAGGSTNFVPVYSDGTNWRIG